MNKKVSILLVIHNGAVWLPEVLDALKKQTYPRELMEICIWDNYSTDQTEEIVHRELHGQDYLVEKNNKNIGFWAGFEKLLPQSTGEYIIACTDVVLDPYFIERAVAVMEQDTHIGALQAKIFQPDKKHIDTLGFQIERSRRVTNRGQGEIDHGQYEKQEEIFAVEGAVPVFRRLAIEDTKVNGHFSDPTFRVGPLSYGDDLDSPWRMHLFGWKQIYVPSVIAYHNRSTTHNVSRSWQDYLDRVHMRRQIPLLKRRLDWSNVRFTIIKNDYIINILKDLPWILAREILVFCYTLVFEPVVFLEAGRFFRLLPTMIVRRRYILRKAKMSAQDMRRWFVTPPHGISKLST